MRVVFGVAGLATAAVLATALAGCGTGNPADAAGAAPDQANVQRDVPVQAVVEPGNPDSPRLGPAEAMPGTTYPFDLYTGCGVRFASFGGRHWEATEALPQPAPQADERGISVHSDFAPGTMTVLDERTARFVADTRYSAWENPVVTFKALAKKPPACGAAPGL